MSKIIARNALLMFLVTLTLGLGACASEYIQDENFEKEDTEFRIDNEARISDNEQHREVLGVLVRYRQALVRKDFGEINQLISDEYYENASTTNTTRDDYGREQLGEVFELLANHAEQIQYRITVKSLEIKNDLAFVDYEYRYAYQYKIGEEVQWDAGIEVNRVELRQVQDKWMIVSGL